MMLLIQQFTIAIAITRLAAHGTANIVWVVDIIQVRNIMCVLIVVLAPNHMYTK